jgi:phosphatidate cytidylyltransferase
VAQFLVVRHGPLCFLAYMAFIVVFVLTLEKDMYKRQFKALAWTVISTVYIVLQSSLFVELMFHGMFWFFVAAGAVVVNDIFAYIWGFFYGRTPLIALSPKKTWEGFVGAAVTTVLFGFLFSWLLLELPFSIGAYLSCPRVSVWHASLACAPSAAFVWTRYALPPWLAAVVRVQHVWMYPAQLHSVALAAFASVIGPFGGFMASGFKRAFKVKDFADVIPGHGGITDRMDCQALMGVFAAFYHTWVVKSADITLNYVLEKAMRLGLEDRAELVRRLAELATHAAPHAATG